MTVYPQYFTWTNQQFVPIDAPDTAELLVADSWRVQHGNSWGLSEHVQRFITGMTAQTARVGQLPKIDPTVFTPALAQHLREVWRQYAATDLFPRISLEPDHADWRIILVVRPAPNVRTATRLWIPHYIDPRTRPTVKGPDISLLRTLVSEIPADDVVLHDGTNVVEATTGALLVWDSPDQLVLCQAPGQLASISARRIAAYAKSQGITVTRRPVTIGQIASGEYPVWFSNTLHGISPVTTVVNDAGAKPIAAHPSVAQWQAAWWTQFRS